MELFMDKPENTVGCIVAPFDKLPETWRDKFYLLEEVSREVLFAYSAKTNVLNISKFGLETFAPGKQPVLTENESFAELLSEKDITYIRDKAFGATPKNSSFTHDCVIKICGEDYHVRFIVKVLFDGQTNEGFIGKCVNNEEEYRRVETLRYAACHDELTGLYRANYARNKITELLSDETKNYMLAIFDIDRFKEVNDDYGHTVGDKVLVSVARKALDNLRTDGHDIISRVGGDEFVVLMEYENDPDATIQKFFDSLKGNIEGVRFSLSMGVADTGLLGRDYDVLFRCADQALYASKRVGRGVCCFYNIKMQGNIFRTI